MKSIRQSMPTWAVAFALGAAVTSAVQAVAQVSDPVDAAQRAQQKENEERGNRESKQGQQPRQERQQLKREREQLDNMPAGAKRLLRAETEGATNIDYFKIPGKGGERNQFGATFTKADHNYDIRVDRDGSVISRTDLTAQARTAAQQPATPAPAQPAPTPAPPTAQAPAQPAPTPAPSATDDKTFRRLQANEIPANIRTVLDREAKGGTDLKYYRTAYGKHSSYTVTWDGADGREHKAYVGDDGTLLARKTGDEADAQTASASEKASQPGRVELAAMPRQVQNQFRKLTEGASDVKFYRTLYGKQDAFQANYTSRDGREHKVYVDENGKILAQKDDSSKKN